MNDISSCVREIVRASRSGKLVFFVGAGVSRLSGFPMWTDLVDRFYFALYGRSKCNSYSLEDCLRVPQMYHDVKGESAYNNLLQEVFAVETTTNAIHEKIVSLNPAHIITTNYDNLIERACSHRGRYYSVISADEDVASSSSDRLILKVHGDFRRGYIDKHIVLREDDYINYDLRFPLISNLLQTIMATHTIVFIGYSLSDYNINLLLNWVKQLQKDGYRKPFFIRSDYDVADPNTAVYYEKRGLRIIDAARIGTTEKTDYISRYALILDRLLESTNNISLATDQEVVAYMHEKLCPLFALQCVRRVDLAHVFEHDYIFEVDGTVQRGKNKGFGYMERYFELIDQPPADLPAKYITILTEIQAFFEANNVINMRGATPSRSANLEIMNPAYHSDFEEMERIASTDAASVEEKFRRAFFLACLGRWSEAYELYSDLLGRTIDSGDHSVIHYLAQINRYRLYQSITQAEAFYSSVGVMVYRKQHKPFSEEFLARVDREMKNFSIEEVYRAMPYDFQEKYRILGFLSNSKFLHDDTVMLFELTNKARSEISKGTIQLGGLASEALVDLRLADNQRFLYDNYLWFANFAEYRNYVRNSLIIKLEKRHYESTRDEDAFGYYQLAGRPQFHIDYYDFVNMCKSFTVDDIRLLLKSSKLDQCEIHGIACIEHYLERMAERVMRDPHEGKAALLYDQFVSELKTAFYLTAYLELSHATLMKLVRAVLFHFPKREADIGTQHMLVERMSRRNGLPSSVVSMIEDFLISQVDKHRDPNYVAYSVNGSFSKDFAELIIHYHKDYVSDRLSTYALSLQPQSEGQIRSIFPLLSLMSADAKAHVLNYTTINNISTLMDSMEMGIVVDWAEHQSLVYEYLDRRKAQALDERAQGRIVMREDSIPRTLAVLYFTGHLGDLALNNYLSIDDEFDMFIDPAGFDYSRLRTHWLDRYSGSLLRMMADNEHMRPHLIRVLIERIERTNDVYYVRILLGHFLRG